MSLGIVGKVAKNMKKLYKIKATKIEAYQLPED